MMNEIVFYHVSSVVSSHVSTFFSHTSRLVQKPSKALIVDDAFYGGYSNATKSFTTPATAELGAKTRGLYGVSTPTPFGRMWFKVSTSSLNKTELNKTESSVFPAV